MTEEQLAAIVHFRARFIPPQEIEGSEEITPGHQASACFWSGFHLAMTPDWAQVTCKNCLKARGRQ